MANGVFIGTFGRPVPQCTALNYISTTCLNTPNCDAHELDHLRGRPEVTDPPPSALRRSALVAVWSEKLCLKL